MSDLYMCGWRVRSEIPLPDLLPWTGDERAPDIQIGLGSVPERIEGAQPAGPLIQVAPDGSCTLEIANVARFLVADGRRVVIDPQPGAGSAAIRLFLLGTVLAMLAHQRGLIGLHASCVRFGAGAVAFGGRAGLGKSTLAAALVQRGCALTADDVSVVDASAQGGAIVYPALPRFKLWQDSLDVLGISSDGLERVRDGMEKFAVPALAAFDRKPVPLIAIYLLRDMREGFQDPPTRLTGFDAVRALTVNVYRPRLWRAMGRERATAAAVLTILAKVPVYDFAVQRDLSALGSVADQLLQRHGGGARPEP